MMWSTVRKFVAAWIGATIGHISAGTGVAHQAKLLERWLTLVEEDPSKMPITFGVVIAVSAFHTTAVMLGYHEKDKAAESAERVVRPRNYFVSGLVSAWLVWLIAASFAGFGIDPNRLAEWLMGGGG